MRNGLGYGHEPSGMKGRVSTGAGAASKCHVHAPLSAKCLTSEIVYV